MTGKRELKREHTPKLWLIPTVAVGAVVAAYAGFCIAAAASGEINPNTTIGGHDVGGLTCKEAEVALKPTLDRLRLQSGVHATLETGEDAAFLTYDELGVTFNAQSLVEEAYESSHSGNPLTDGWELLCSSLGKSTAVTPQPEPGWQKTAAERLADASDLDASDFSYAAGDSSLTLTKARNGRDVDRAALQARLGDAKADADGARSVLLPYTVVYADQGDLNELNRQLGGEMSNARYDAETKTIVPERPALNFNVTQAQQLLDAAAPGEQVTVPAKASNPEVTAAELEKVLFRDVLGTYTTRVGGAAGRKANVRLTAQRVNGTVLNSGEEFNYYDLTGPFTKANGYQSAPGYLQGKTVEMDGGGACQCSSTTYAAALLANLEIVKRTAHGFASDYIGLGLDATVSGGGPEFIFRNNTLYPILIETVYSDDNRLTVNIYGTKTDDTTVKMRTEVLSSTPYEEEYKESEEIAPGERKVEQTPYTGYVVNTYRQIYDGAGNLISETFEARSKYNKRNRIILVAPGELPSDEPAEEGAEAAEGGEAGNGGATQPTDGAGSTNPAPADNPNEGGGNG
jgi:vancomycin resistance protein YoaR